MDSQAVANANAQNEWMQDIVSWIVSADADDVSSAVGNADAAAHLAPRLADNALAAGGHDSEFTMVRVVQMSGLMSGIAEIATGLAAVHAEAALDYDSAVPLFERGRMTVPEAEITNADDRVSGGIVRTGMNRDDTRAFTSNGSSTLQSAETISRRPNVDFVGAQKIVSTEIPVFDTNGVQVVIRAEITEFDRRASGKPYEYIKLACGLRRPARISLQSPQIMPGLHFPFSIVMSLAVL